MAKIKANTTKMRECGNDIMTISNEIGTEFNNIFDRISNMPTSTFEWTGESANAFVLKANSEKVQYMQLKDVLYNYGKYLVDCANNLDNEITNLRNN